MNMMTSKVEQKEEMVSGQQTCFLQKEYLTNHKIYYHIKTRLLSMLLIGIS